MKRFRSSLFLAICTILLAHGSGIAGEQRERPTFSDWSVDCLNTGLCLGSTYVREQAAWLDLRLVRDWPAQAEPMIRLTTNLALKPDGNIRLTVDGTLIEELPVEQLREVQSSITTPDGFVPIGGEGFWYPTGPATRTLINAMKKGNTLSVHLPGDPDAFEVKVSLIGLTSSLIWLDEQQDRSTSQSALALTGDDPAKDAPNAISVSSPSQLPPTVAESWNNGRFCSDIDPALFAGLGAVAASLDGKSTLYLLPCGAPTAYNAAYIALLANSDGKVRQLGFARMSDAGPVAIDLVYNARWSPKTMQLESFFKASGLGECGLWNRWQWTGTAFALIAEATRSTCNGEPAPLATWDATWPPPQHSE